MGTYICGMTCGLTFLFEWKFLCMGKTRLWFDIHLEAIFPFVI